MNVLRPALRGLLVTCLAATSIACSYRGAIYSSYQELGLGIKATAESNSPVKVHLGYNRGTGAWIPRRGGGEQAEEAVAVISRDDVLSTVNPTRLGEDSILQADSALISGTAAIVASAPSGAIVVVKPSPDSGKPAPEAVDAAAGAVKRVRDCDDPAQHCVSFQALGSPGERIATALAGAPRLSPSQLKVKVLLDLLSKRSNQKKVFGQASALMPADFQALYAARADLDPAVAFRSAALDYLHDAPDRDARTAALQSALERANSEVP